MLFGCGVVFLQEVDDTAIVHERDLVTFGECRQLRHVCARCAERSENVLRQRDVVEFEMRLEEQGRDVVKSPLAGVFERITVLTMSLCHEQRDHASRRKADTKYA